MHTQNQPPNAGVRQQFNNGPPRPFIPLNQGTFYNQQRGHNPTYFQNAPPNLHYNQLPQVNPGASINESATSPPSVASTPGLPHPGPPLSASGHPLQPGPAVYYSVPQQQPQQALQPQQQQPTRFIAPQQGQHVYLPFPPPQLQQQQGGGHRIRAPHGQRAAPAMMQYQQPPPNFNMNQQRYPLPFNPQGVVMPPPMEGQYFDPPMQQQQHPLQQQHFQKNTYQGKNRRGGGGNGNSSHSSRRGSIRHDGRPDSSNRPSSQPSPPEAQLPQFAEQNVPIQQGQIMQQNPMYAVSQFPQQMMVPQGQQFYVPYNQESQMGQPVYLIQGDPNYQNQYFAPGVYHMVLPPQQMQQQQMQQQMMQMDPQQQHPHHFVSPPLSNPESIGVDGVAMVQAIESLIHQKEEEQHQRSPENVEPAAVPAMDAVSVKGDADDYTPPGTPQSLHPVDEQQVSQMLDEINREGDKLDQQKDEKAFEKEDNRKQESHRKRQLKPEQQHYQPPRGGGRTNAQRTNSWRNSTNQQQQSGHLSKISEEKPKPTYPTAPPAVVEPPKSASIPSDTPTPRASPTPPPKLKEVVKVADVPMIGGVPLIGGKPVAGATEKLDSTKTEHCAFCEMRGKPRHEISSHSLYSAKGIPACPGFREEGCKLCFAKGDGAHLPEKCRKYVENKENTGDFKGMANTITNMSPSERSSILIKDMGSHPSVQEIQSHPDPEFQKGIENGMKQLFCGQQKFKEQDQQEFEQKEAAAERQQRQHGHGQRHYQDERNHREPYRGNRSGPRGGGDRGGRGGYGNRHTYTGSQSRDGSRGGSTGGRGRGGGGHRDRGGNGQYGSDRRSNDSRQQYRT